MGALPSPSSNRSGGDDGTADLWQATASGGNGPRACVDTGAPRPLTFYYWPFFDLDLPRTPPPGRVVWPTRTNRAAGRGGQDEAQDRSFEDHRSLGGSPAGNNLPDAAPGRP